MSFPIWISLAPPLAQWLKFQLLSISRSTSPCGSNLLFPNFLVSNLYTLVTQLHKTTYWYSKKCPPSKKPPHSMLPSLSSSSFKIQLRCSVSVMVSCTFRATFFPFIYFLDKCMVGYIFLYILIFYKRQYSLGLFFFLKVQDFRLHKPELET